ncbi:hypothetical protein Dimus_022447 [Dionaea muscipula]
MLTKDVLPFSSQGISDGISSEAAPTISATDIEVSRHRISLFLSQHTAYELLPESSKLGNHGSNLTEE